ncbi:MAG: hypothetical protein IPP13_21815 [Kouleothrix sp.]|jgi:hypothetical protein|nr:hypothetical protein [Kouleothrix sp.]
MDEVALAFWAIAGIGGAATTAAYKVIEMCSIIGGQQHLISGRLALGETTIFLNTGSPIWNNSLPNPSSLYNPSGQLVSYRSA